MIRVPKVKVSELEGDSKKVVLHLIREFSKPVSRLMGVDATEEAMIDLLDKGLIKILSDGENFWLGIYDSQLGDYKNMTGDKNE